jgi:uncharacterized protein
MRNMTIVDAFPTQPIDRLQHVDAIRGLALFGVLLVNLYGHDELALTEAQIAAMPTAAIDHWLGFAINVLWTGKAQALFSMLFGFGFALQMQRAEARGAPFAGVYLRRLTVLLGLGLVHLWLFFAFDILHVYALMGFFLLFVRRLPTSWLLGLGLAFSVLPWPVFFGWLDSTAINDVTPLEQLWDEGVARRSVLFLGSDFSAYARELWHSSFDEYLATPYGLTFFLYVFGRFLLGYWIARKGFLTAPAEHAEQLRIERPVLLWAGLTLAIIEEGIAWLPIDYSTQLFMFTTFIDEIAKLLLACAYALILMQWMQRGAFPRLTRALSAVGRMALTNYLMQTLVYLFVLYGFGLALLPKAGAGFCVALALLVFILQMGLSQYWLARFRFGPAEWLWRYLTYTRRP